MSHFGIYVKLRRINLQMVAGLSHVAFIVKELERVDGILKARNTRYRRDVSSFVPENNGGHNYVNCMEKKKHCSILLKIDYKSRHLHESASNLTKLHHIDGFSQNIAK